MSPDFSSIVRKLGGATVAVLAMVVTVLSTHSFGWSIVVPSFVWFTLVMCHLALTKERRLSGAIGSVMGVAFICVETSWGRGPFAAFVYFDFPWPLVEAPGALLGSLLIIAACRDMRRRITLAIAGVLLQLTAIWEIVHANARNTGAFEASFLPYAVFVLMLILPQRASENVTD